jgi:hypothetical protein
VKWEESEYARSWAISVIGSSVRRRRSSASRVERVFGRIRGRARVARRRGLGRMTIVQRHGKCEERGSVTHLRDLGEAVVVRPWLALEPQLQGLPGVPQPVPDQHEHRLDHVGLHLRQHGIVVDRDRRTTEPNRALLATNDEPCSHGRPRGR